MFGRRKYEDEAYESDDENAIGGSFVPPMPLTARDGWIALALGAFAAVFAWALSYSGLHPTAWSECAVAAGLRPATTLFPGLWRLVARALYNLLGIGGANLALTLLGKVFGGAIIAFVYLICREMLAILVRMPSENTVWKDSLSRWISALAALLLLCSDPFWSLAQVFTSTTLLAFEFVLSIYLLTRFLGSGTVRPIYAAMLVIGFFGAETPLGLVLLIAFWSAFYMLLTRGSIFHVRLLDPLVQQSSKWLITVLWAVGLLSGIAINVLGFISFDGLSATGLTLGALPQRYAVEMYHVFAGAANAGGWIVGLGFTFLPFVLAVALLRRATDLEYFLSYHVGIVFFVVGCLAYSQLSGLAPLWFWTWSHAIAIESGLLLFVGALMCALAVLSTLAVGSVDAYCRDHRRLAEQMDPDVQLGVRGKNAALYRNIAFAAVGVLLLAGAVPGRVQPKTLRMLSIVEDFVGEVLNEAEGATWLFTDGNFDCGIELGSTQRRGRDKTLFCLPLVVGRQARGAYSVRQAMEDDEDRLCAEIGGGNILRTWQKDKPEKIAQSAMMLGLEIWKDRSGRDYPPVSGVLAKTAWSTPEALEKGRENGYRLVERVLSLYTAGGPDERAGEYVNDLFLFIQWRLSRLARVRSELYDRAGDVARAKEDLSIAESLDDRNASLKRILEGMTRLKENTMRQMTPREGLQFALVRADFPLARRYAAPILDADPEDVDANFGMGMSYLMEEQYGRAEEYLRRSLVRKPKEPAIWNNIAVIEYRQGRLKEARENALKALALLPDSAEVKDTLKKIEDALAKAAKPAAKDAKPSEKDAKPSEKK